MQGLLKQFLLRWLVNFLGLWTAATLLTGISYQQHLRVLIWAALVFSLVNAVIRPLVVILSLPAIVLSLGLFTFTDNDVFLPQVSHCVIWLSALGRYHYQYCQLLAKRPAQRPP